MQSLDRMPPALAAGVEILFSDIDDTISTDGRITASAFDALWRAHEAGLQVVPVTGRPAGWCDHIARMWPVHGVIGENGGLAFRMGAKGMERHFVYDDETRRGFRKRLGELREGILREVPGCGIASDQGYREYDLAIDFCEDVPALAREDVLRIRELFEQAGATAKISSIHVNGWYGDFDKRSAVIQYLEREFGLDAGDPAVLRRCAFAGDSPNDEPLFRLFPQSSLGVANLLDFEDLLSHKPAWIASGRGGAGFAELVDTLLDARS